MRWHRHSKLIISAERWKRVRNEVLKRDQYKCVQCGASGRLECDHIKPVRDGGAAYDLSNLQILCKACHAVKTQAEVFKNGKIDPEQVKWRKLLKTGMKTNSGKP